MVDKPTHWQPKLERMDRPPIPLFQYIEKDSREYEHTLSLLSDRLPGSPSIVLRHTRGFKWFLNGRFSGAWVNSVDDETDFDKLATALYVARRIRRSRFWAWWYRTFFSIRSYFVGEGVTGNEWPENLR